MDSTIEQKLARNFKNIPVSFIREILKVANQPGMISFAGGLPNPRFFPVQALQQAAHEVLANQGREILQYADSRGYEPLRQWIAQRYSSRFDMNIDADSVVLTNGSQQAIDVVSKMFLDTGDGVIVERPTYLGALQSMSAYSPKWCQVDLENDDPNFDQVDQACNTHSPKFMYAVPNYQNPSGLSYSENSKLKLAKILEKRNLILLEDDPYNEIYFEKPTTAPIKKHSPNKVFWTGSFSKMVAPGLRMGWVVVPDGFSSHFVKTKQASDLHSNNLTQHMVYHFLSNNDLDEHLSQIRKAYRTQCEFMKQELTQLLPGDVQITNPKGGMFLWLSLPQRVDANVLVEACLKKGLVFVPGNSFYVDGSGHNKMRLNFSNDDCPTIEKGVQILASALKTMYKPSLVTG